MRRTNLENSALAARQPPLIKWPGGKRTLVDSLVSHIPAKFGTYYEPFFGGGALFFALRPSQAIIGDVNPELINAYQVVRDDPDALVKVLKTFKNNEESYYAMRNYRPRTAIRRAARFLYLTRLSFNGIHRVNLKGIFNVPYGYKTHLDSYDEEGIRRVSEMLADVQILAGDFAAVTANAAGGDLVYFDPPYTVAHSHNGFVKYNERIFSWADQIRLAEHSKALADRGCTVIVSNADHHSVRTLYREAKMVVLKRNSVISASSVHRREITECVFILSGR